MSNPVDMMGEDAIADLLVLAAIDRAERHRAKGHAGVPVWAIRDHLQIDARSPGARRLASRLSALAGAGVLGRGRRSGVVVWTLAAAGREQLHAAQRAGGAPALPESPQHVAWRQARAAAAARTDGFAAALGEEALQAISMLDAVRAGQPADSDAWFALADALQRACRRLGSAIHCLHEWAEPGDDRADADDRLDPADERLGEAECAKRRSRRAGRRNVALWDAASAPSAPAGANDRRLVGLGRAVRQLRAERGLSARDLAVAARLTPRSLAAIEAGRRDPAYDVLLALARALNVSSAALVERAEAETKRGAA